MALEEQVFTVAGVVVWVQEVPEVAEPQLFSWEH